MSEIVSEIMGETGSDISSRPASSSGVSSSATGTSGAASSTAACSEAIGPDASCPCGSDLAFEACCGPRLDGTKPPRNPVELLRARYCAYCLGRYDYLVDTHLPPEGEDAIPAEVLAEHLKDVTWESLDILEEGHDEKTGCPYVEFRAFYDMPDARRVLAERSYFREVDGAWFYVDGEPINGGSVRREHPKIGRNEPCPCGSGKKYKKCCGRDA